MVLLSRKILYNTVLSQALSDCGKYLFAGNTFGDIFVLSLKQFRGKGGDEDFSAEEVQQLVEPKQIFNVSEVEKVNSLSFYKNTLIVGTTGTITGYSWDDENQELKKKLWQIQIPSSPDINILWLDKGSDLLYAGCGDNLIYAVDLDSIKIVRNFTGHRDFIHSLTGWESRIFSASEDGSIIFWDVRNSESVGKLEPYKNKKLARPEFGKWQGTVSVTDDWLICGGGPRSSMFHLRSLECTNILAFPNKAHCSGFCDDVFFVAGEHSTLHQYSFNGDITAEVPISGPAVYSIVWQNEPIKIMSVGGASNNLDICTNFNYKDMVIKLYKAGKN